MVSRPPTPDHETTMAAVLAYVRTRPGERLSPEEILEAVQVGLEFDPSPALIHRACLQLAANRLNSLRKAGREFVWSLDGTIPPRQKQRRGSRAVRNAQYEPPVAAIDNMRPHERLAQARNLARQSANNGDVWILEGADYAEECRNLLIAALEYSGPMNVEAASRATGLSPELVQRLWPEDKIHMRLGLGPNERSPALTTTASPAVLRAKEAKWTDADIIASLQEAAVYEFPLTKKAYVELLNIGQIKGPSTASIGHRFGSWTAACDAAGVVPGTARRGSYESRWSDNDVLQIVRDYLLDPNAPISAQHYDKWKIANAPDGPSLPTVLNRFGSWTNVKRAAFHE
jgi:hypothetical protein